MLDLPDTSKKRIACRLEWDVDKWCSFSLKTQVASSIIIGMDQKKKVVSPDLVFIIQCLVTFMKMDKPGETPGVCCHDVVSINIIFLCGDIASV